MWKYNGNGFIVGIPARDLTDKEAKLYKDKPGFDNLYEKVLRTRRKQHARSKSVSKGPTRARDNGRD